MSPYVIHWQAMDMDEGNVDLRSTIAIDRANALLRLKRFEDALEDCDMAIEFGKPSTNAYIIRSMANTSLLKFEEAVRDLEEALGIDPDSAIIKERLKKAQVELRKSKRVDYYKVLGISEVRCRQNHALSVTSLTDSSSRPSLVTVLWRSQTHPTTHA